MNIRWNIALSRFEAEFSSDFNGDYSAVKVAGFKTDGPPAWIWHTQKIAVLNKLREKKPASGLTITPEALEIYKPLALQEEQNQAIKKQLADAKKEAKKKQKELAKCDWLPPGKEYLDTEDLPLMPPFVSPRVNTAIVPDLKCIYCAQPVYFYEYPEIPACLWCSKIMLDKESVTC